MSRKTKTARIFRAYSLLSSLVLGLVMAPAHAVIIHESATLGATGLYSGVNIQEDQWLGSRFTLSNTMDITQIGGHLASEGTIFGAIVALPSPTGFPDPAAAPFGSGGNTIADVALAYTVFDAGFPSGDYLTPLSVTLDPGDYALIFGSNSLGATGWGRMPTSNSDLPGSSYFIGLGVNLFDTGEFDDIQGMRFLVNGEPSLVPEPASIALLGLGLVGLGFAGRRRN